jgi:hypothetical protein
MQIWLKLLLASYYSPCLTFASSIHQTLKNKKNEGAKNTGLAKVNILYVENYAEYVPHGGEFFVFSQKCLICWNLQLTNHSEFWFTTNRGDFGSLNSKKIEIQPNLRVCP